jgi:lysophospholipase L1-like esterase
MQKFISTISSAAIALTAMPYLSGDAVSAAVNDTDTVKIMCIGDSITDGYVPEYEGSYRKFIYHDLTEKGYKVDMVGSKGEGYTPEFTDESTGESFGFDNGNTGYSGYAIKSYAGRNGILETLKQTNCLEEQKPDIITLQIGTNNIIDNHDMDENMRDLGDLIDYILDSTPEDTVLYVTSIPALDPNRTEVYDWFSNYRHSPDWQTQYSDEEALESVNNAVKEYNSRIDAMIKDRSLTEEEAKAENVKIRLRGADVGSVISDVKTLLFDGVHPNNDGYRAMGTYWAGMLEDEIKGRTKTAPAVTTTTASASVTTTAKPAVTTTATKPATTTTKTTATTTATTSKTTTTTKDPYIWDPDATTTTVSEEEFNRIRVSDLIAFSRYLIGDNRLGFDERRLKLYDINKDKKLDTYDLILMRKELLTYGAKLREKFGEDYCMFEGGRDITIIDPDAEPERVESGSSGSHSVYVAVTTDLIDLDTMTDKEIVALYVEKNLPIYDQHHNVVKPEDIKYDENEYAYVINADGEKELLFRWMFETENVYS